MRNESLIIVMTVLFFKEEPQIDLRQFLETLFLIEWCDVAMKLSLSYGRFSSGYVDFFEKLIFWNIFYINYFVIVKFFRRFFRRLRIIVLPCDVNIRARNPEIFNIENVNKNNYLLWIDENDILQSNNELKIFLIKKFSNIS